MARRYSALRLACLATLALALLSSLPGQQEARAFDQDDMVLGRSEASDSFRVYDKSAGSWSAGPGWAEGFVQSVEFDNSNSVSHNAAGNLVGANFGNAFTGFEMFNFATTGGSAYESVWSIVDATGGIKGTNPMGAWLSERGGGVSFSPDNTKVAWTNWDTGHLHVHDYAAGGTPGTGAGASVTGPRRTGAGPFATALRVGSTSGTAWLDDSTVAAFSGFGEIITWDISSVAAGSEDGTLAGWNPTVGTNWEVANDEVAFIAQYTDIEYNPLIDEDHIFASVTRSDFSATLYAYDYDPDTGTISLNTSMNVGNAPNGEPREPREIALDSQGNLFYSGYAGSGSDNIVMMLPNATNVAGWNPANVAVFYNNGDYTGFNGFDVAASISTASPGLLGDYNDDGKVDGADYTSWRDALTAGSTSLMNDSTPGTVDESDFTYWRDHYGEMSMPGGGAGSGSVAVPEPCSLALLALGLSAILTSARRKNHGTK